MTSCLSDTDEGETETGGAAGDEKGEFSIVYGDRGGHVARFGIVT